MRNLKILKSTMILPLIKKISELKFSGVPLEMTISGGEKGKGGTITLAATKIEDSVDRNIFKLDTTGYEKMDMDELQKMGGGM